MNLTGKLTWKPDPRNQKVWTHEETYRGWGIRSRVHQKRLQKLLDLFAGMNLPSKGTLADVGCSNGFILEKLNERFSFTGSGWELFGFDHVDSLIDSARERGLGHTSFHNIDITKPVDPWYNRFDVVICLETLEHTSNACAALMNLVSMTKAGGILLVSVPNEKGAQGLLKLFGRPLLNPRVYGDFFVGKSRLSYTWHLISGRRIDGFRGESPDGWGPHLGFDYKILEEYLMSDLVKTGQCELIERTSSFLNFNVFYKIKRRDHPGSTGILG